MTDIQTLTPVFIIYMNGTRISADMESSIQEVSVTENTNDASMFTVSLSDPGNKWKNSKDLDIGTKLKILLGYKDAVAELITGEIVDMRSYFGKDAKASLKLICSDPIHKMERAVTTAGFNDKTMGEIIKTLAEKAGMNAEIKGADDQKKFILQRDMTDIQFIRNYAEEKNAAFIVKNGKFVFKPLKEMPGGADVILEYEKTLIEFEAFRESRNMCGSVETRGFDYSNFKSISKTLQSDTMSLKIGGEAVAPKTADSAYGKKISILTDLSVIDEKAAEARCDSALGEMSGKYMYISRRCQGNVLIHAGNNINIKNTGKSYSGIYFLTSVTHRLVPMRGYTVDFEGYRNALPSPPKVPPKDVQPQEEKKKEEGKLNPEFTNLAWKLDDKAVEKAHVGDKLKLTADCSQMGSMKSVNVKIYEKDTTTPDDFIEEIKGKVIGGNKVEAVWTFIYTEDEDDANSDEEKKEKGYTKPEYYFVIETLNGKHKSSKSGICEMMDIAIINIQNSLNCAAMENMDIIIVTADGKEIKGKTDKNGLCIVKDLPPGKCEIKIGNDLYDYISEQYEYST